MNEEKNKVINLNLGKQIFSFNTALQKTKITHKKAIEILKDK